MPDFLHAFLMILMGIALAAACGFRVFVPMLVISIAAMAGQVTLSPGFDWVGTWPALLMFAVATGLEIAAYYIPWLDNLLDTLATPAAVVAGSVVAASFITGMHPSLQWALALIVGGGAAAGVQLTTVAVRAVSTATTGGLGNPLVATGEWAGAAIISILVVVLGSVAAIALLIVMALMLVKAWRFVRGRRSAAAELAIHPAPARLATMP